MSLYPYFQPQETSVDRFRKELACDVLPFTGIYRYDVRTGEQSYIPFFTLIEDPDLRLQATYTAPAPTGQSR